MKEIQILVVGKHPEILATIARLISKRPGWACHCTTSADEACAHPTTPDLVLMDAGLTQTETTRLTHHFTVPVVQHYGGGSGLLYAEVYQALGLPAHIG